MPDASAHIHINLGVSTDSDTLVRWPQRAFYSARGILVSPISPSRCAPPALAATMHHEVRQCFWSAEAEKVMENRGIAAKRKLHEEALLDGSLIIRLVHRGRPTTAM